MIRANSETLVLAAIFLAVVFWIWAGAEMGMTFDGAPNG